MEDQLCQAALDYHRYPQPGKISVLPTKGMSNQQIADTLFISYRTVTTHVSHIMTKLDVPTRTAAVSFAILNGIASQDLWARTYALDFELLSPMR